MVFSRNYVEELLSEILCTFSGILVVGADFSYFGHDVYFWGDTLLSNEVQKFIADRVPIYFCVHFGEIPKKDIILERVKCTVKNGESVSDPTGVAVAWGHEAKAKGCLGAYLILSDWRYIGEKWFDGDYKTPYDVESWELDGAKMVQVDGEKIKADTYYRCVDGEVVEADE